MKRVIATLMAAVLVLSMVACGSSPATSGTSSSNQTINVDNNLFSVEVTLPADMITGGDDSSGQEDLKDYCAKMEAEDGIESATVNDDGSVTLKMTKAKHKEMLDGMKASLDESIAEYTNGETYTSIKGITYNSDVTEFQMQVDSAAYANSFDGFVVLGLGFAGMYYDLLSGDNDPHITIVVTDATSGTEVGTSVFPDDFADMLDDSAA